jgi:hypothetical protein
MRERGGEGGEVGKGEDTGNKLSIVLLPYNERPLGSSPGSFTYPRSVLRLTLFPSFPLPPPLPFPYLYPSQPHINPLSYLQTFTFPSVLSPRACTQTEYLSCHKSRCAFFNFLIRPFVCPTVVDWGSLVRPLVSHVFTPSLFCAFHQNNAPLFRTTRSPLRNTKPSLFSLQATLLLNRPRTR